MRKIFDLFLILLIVLFIILLNKNYFYKEKVIIKNEVIPIKSELGLIDDNKESLNPNLSYLLIDRLNIKNIIVEGTNDDILDKNVIGIHKASVCLNSSYGNIILAGHNNKYVFKNLKDIKINDEIKLIYKNVSYKFYVVDINLYKDDDYSYFKYIYDKKVLTLITCSVNNGYRLVVVAEEG